MINQFGNFGMTLVIQYILCYDLSVNIYWIKTREIKKEPPTMKKTSIIFTFCTLLFVTACSTSENQTQATEATGTIEQVETESILIKNFKEKKDKYNPEAAIRFDIVDKYYDETGNKIKRTELNKNDNIKIILTKDFQIQETSPAQIDPKYVQKIILLNK